MVDAMHEVGSGVGWGGDDNVLCTCTHGWCYATSCFLHLHTWSVLRNTMGWGGVGVGWGGDDNILCTCTHGWCYATSCFLHLHTWSVLRNTMRWGGVGMITFFALAHMVGATQHHVSCTCTHGRCYATSCFLQLHTWSVLCNIMFLALAHMVGATQHHVLDQNSINLFRRLVGDEVCKERCDSYVLTAGDNRAESLCAVSKNNWDAPIWILQWRKTRLSTVIFWVHTF